jgi:hypothetical protein
MVSFAVLSPDLRFDPRNLVGSVERLGGNIDRVSGNFAPDGALYAAEAAGNGTASADCGVMGDGQVCAGDGSRYARAKVNQNASVCWSSDRGLASARSFRGYRPSKPSCS